MSQFLLAIDQGTTNSKAVLFDIDGRVVAKTLRDLQQSYPESGWVEQSPNEMFENVIFCCQNVLKESCVSANQIAAIGISNQRETTIIWDKLTGETVYPAIVWQDRRTAELCAQLQQSPISALLPQKTGLLLDPYFSLTKILWILEHVPNARARAKKGELLFGTVDTYLLWRLTDGKSHLTDATNASRTLLFNLHTQTWDEDILSAFDIPKTLLPDIRDNSAEFGMIQPRFLGREIPITAMIGDQQAATVGQAILSKGMVKATFGTGAFLLLNTGDKIVTSAERLLSTVAYRLRGKVTYGLEGSIFCAGTTVKWLRDVMHLIETAAETENIAAQLTSTDGVYLVPAFTGLGAPYWEPDVRAAIFGLSRGTGREHIVRAGLESVAYQTADLLAVMTKDSAVSLKDLRVDGGMAANNWLMQFLADMIDLQVARPTCIETTAWGAAFLAGLTVGIYSSLNDVCANWREDANFKPKIAGAERNMLYLGWKEVVKRLL